MEQRAQPEPQGASAVAETRVQRPAPADRRGMPRAAPQSVRQSKDLFVPHAGCGCSPACRRADPGLDPGRRLHHPLAVLGRLMMGRVAVAGLFAAPALRPGHWPRFHAALEVAFLVGQQSGT